MSRRGMGFVLIDLDLLKQALHMPETAEVEQATVDPFGFGRPLLKLLVASPDLPPLEEGRMIPEVWPTITHHAERFEWDWNLSPATVAPAVTTEVER